MKISRNYERGQELMCQAMFFSRSDKLQIKEQRKKVHRKETMRGIKKEPKKLVYVIVVVIDTFGFFCCGVT
jgi:hypothetical protein